ncbi:MAG: potassium-transporting ATPase subunit KdpC [Gammaproteobacteria bacterium]
MTTSILRPAVSLLVAMTVITGIAYPAVITGIAKLAFPDAAAGSVILRDGTPVASRLIGQNFSDPKYFWGRPSATGSYAYNGTASAGTNQGPLNPALTDAVKQRIEALRSADPTNTKAVPVDLVTASASGLDPHISVAAFEYQIARVAKARNMSPDAVRTLTAPYIEDQAFGFLGEPRVNVVEVNLALDAAKPAAAR